MNELLYYERLKKKESKVIINDAALIDVRRLSFHT